MNLRNINNTISSKIHDIPDIIFREGALKITAGAMTEIVDMLCTNSVEEVVSELSKLIPVTDSLVSDIKIRNGMLGSCKV